MLGSNTLWVAVPELALKTPPPEKPAVRVRSPSSVSTMEHWPAATSALQVSKPSEAVTCTVPTGVPPADVTSKTTRTAAPVAEESGSSEAIRVPVTAGLTAMVDDVTEVNPPAAKIRECAPVAPPMLRLVNVARPSGPVVWVAVPASWPVPVAMAAVTVTPGA